MSSIPQVPPLPYVGAWETMHSDNTSSKVCFSWLQAVGRVTQNVANLSSNGSSTSNAAYDQANAAYTTANVALADAAIGITIGESAYAQANAATLIGENAYAQANAARTTANAAAIIGGTSTQVQFNDAGSLAGDGSFLWDKTNKKLTILGASTQAPLSLNTVGTGAVVTMSAGSGNVANILLTSAGVLVISSNSLASGAGIILSANGGLQFIVQEGQCTVQSQLLASSTIVAPSNPASNVQTRAFTGCAVVMGANTASVAGTLTNEANLSITLPETGTYQIDGYLSFYEATLGTGGFQFDLAGGTVGITWINWAADGYVTSVVGNPAALATNIAQSYATVATSPTAPSWVRITGTMKTSNNGTFIPRWAQASGSVNATNLLQGSRLTITKIA